jgi:hypothetical protein
MQCRVARSTFLSPPGLSLQDSLQALTLPFHSLPREAALGRAKPQNKRPVKGALPPGSDDLMSLSDELKPERCAAADAERERKRERTES